MAADARKRLFTLAGVIPAAAFLIEHLVVTGSAMGGQARFDRVMGGLARSSFLTVFEILFVYAPLGYHALYGLHLTFKPVESTHTYASDGLLRLQKISGVVVLAFIGLHFWQIRLQRLNGAISERDLYTHLVEKLASTTGGVPWFALVMLIGVAATVFHLVNGLWAFRAQNERPDRRATRVFVLFGLVLFAIGGGTVVSVATGARYLPAAEPEKAACGPQAAPAATPRATPSSQEAGKTP